MAQQRGLERVVNLTDAVVAIAATLLVLPLVDLAGEVQGHHVSDLLRDNGDKLLAFVLSFVVIARFWVVHHRIYRDVVGYVPLLVWANFLWLIGIIFLPFPTELVGTRGVQDSHAAALYIGTLGFTTIAATLQQAIVVRNPELQHESVRGTISLVESVLTSVSMIVALVVSVVVPSVGLWSLLLLVLTDPVSHLINRRRGFVDRPM